MPGVKVHLGDGPIQVVGYLLRFEPGSPPEVCHHPIGIVEGLQTVFVWACKEDCGRPTERFDVVVRVSKGFPHLGSRAAFAAEIIEGCSEKVRHVISSEMIPGLTIRSLAANNKVAPAEEGHYKFAAFIGETTTNVIYGSCPPVGNTSRKDIT